MLGRKQAYRLNQGLHYNNNSPPVRTEQLFLLISDSDGLPNGLGLLEHAKHEMGDVGA